ncbi:MAG: efflux RND transporter periplasmic adaptor subunit [Acidobacteria bacterium]|nr:efflux RND transporter periplasmic adaptor subunit [Acidobacteriota bacterium]
MRFKKVVRIAGALILLSGLAVTGNVYRKPIAQSAKSAKAWFLNEKAASASETQVVDHSQHQAAEEQPEHTGHAEGERQIAYWYDPMHPQYKSDKPGTAPDCGMNLAPMYQDELEKMADMPPGAVMLTPDKQQLIGVRTGTVEVADLSRTLRTVGRVETDQTKIARVHAKYQGWIDEVYVDFVGKQVRKGQPLFSIYSPELVATQQEYLIALRAQKLLTNETYREIGGNANSLLDSAIQRLRLWDISEDQIERLEKTGEVTRTLVLNSPVDGYVMMREAYPKTAITPDKELYTIVDLSTVWINLDIYEYEAPFVTTGYTARMTLPYAPGKSYKGTVTYIYPDVSLETRTLKARLEFPNPNLELKPGMYADIELEIRIGRKLQIPAEAVLDSGTRKVVFVAKPGGYFEPREIQVGAKFDGRFIVDSGLEAGETIVTSGNFLIDSESRLSSTAGGAHAHGEKK